MKTHRIFQRSSRKPKATYNTTRDVLRCLGDEYKTIESRWERSLFKDLLRYLVRNNQLRRLLFSSWLQEKNFPTVLYPIMLDYLVSQGMQEDINRLFDPEYCLEWEHGKTDCVLTFAADDKSQTRTLLTDCFYAPCNAVSFFDKGIRIENRVVLRDEFIGDLKMIMGNDSIFREKYLGISALVSSFKNIQKQVDEFQGTEIICLSNAIGMFCSSALDYWIGQNDELLNQLVKTLIDCQEKAIKMIVNNHPIQVQRFSSINFNVGMLLAQYRDLRETWLAKRNLAPVAMSESVAALKIPR